jgi:hypothetical protein
MRKKKKFENEDTMVVCHCTAYYSKISTAILEEMMKPENKKKHIVLVLFFHNSDHTKEEWERKWHNKLKKVMRYHFNNMFPVEKNNTEFKYELKTESMPHLISDIS